MTRVQNFFMNIQRWFDSDAGLDHIDATSRAFNIVRVIPFLALHLACLLAFYTGVSGFAAGFALVFFWLRMFAITGFYHRYFAHKTFKTSRAAQFILGCSVPVQLNGGPFGGQRITGTTTSILTGNKICTPLITDRKSTRLNSSHVRISYAVFCLKKKKKKKQHNNNNN